MKKKLSLIIILASLSFGTLTACGQKTTSENADQENANLTVETINKENQVDQIYYQKLTFDKNEMTVDQAANQIGKQIGTEKRTGQLAEENTDKNADALIALYSEETVYNIAMYAVTKALLEKNDYDFEKLLANDKANIELRSNAEELQTNAFLALPYDENEADQLFIVWENKAGTKSYFALGNPKNAEEEETKTVQAATQEDLNKEHAVGTTYYQTASIMYDETNIDTYVKALEKEAGIQNRSAVINQKISDGNTLIALYGEESISNLALYTINLENFEKVDYDVYAYTEQYLQSSESIMIAEQLLPNEYAVVRCDESEGVPTYMVAWTDAGQKQQFLVVTYNGKGNE